MFLINKRGILICAQLTQTRLIDIYKMFKICRKDVCLNNGGTIIIYYS